MTGCADRAEKSPISTEKEIETSPQQIDESKDTKSDTASSKAEQAAPLFDYEDLSQKITYGKATALEVRNALTEQNPAALSNTMHALYSMRWQRVIVYLLNDLWKLDKNKYPDLAWNLIEKPPVRIALASTINRIQIHDTKEYKDYIRAHKYDEHEFHRAQVIISLGLNKNPKDVPYLQEMGEGNNNYVAQSAITALALMHHVLARDAMVTIWGKYANDPRGDLILEVLKKAYDWVPYARKKEETNEQDNKASAVE
ncbi:MAG: HEAT repeat domain-containing protein [Gammaproteobacteria bacterium]|nr:HEAT repeat domain-containing protein [Gammaproteobacteria bacterium]